MIQKYLLSLLMVIGFAGDFAVAQAIDAGSDEMIAQDDSLNESDIEDRQWRPDRPGRPGRPGRPQRPPPRPPRPPQPPHRPPPHYPPNPPHAEVTCYASDYYGRWYQGSGWNVSQAMTNALNTCEYYSNSSYCRQGNCYR